MNIALKIMLVMSFGVVTDAHAGSVSSGPKPVVQPEAIVNALVPVTDVRAAKVPLDRFVPTFAGAWVGDTVGPTIYQRGAWYSGVPINPVGPVNNSNVTTTVYYTWSTSYWPAGLNVYLCNYARCVNISSVQSMGTNAFAGDSANSQFNFYFGVAGTGLLSPPVYGQRDQVIVNFN